METGPAKNLDWITKPGEFFIAWGLPIFALVLSVAVFEGLKEVVWPVSLAWMGIGCLMNAKRCHRRHCFYTGPFFLVLALVSFLHGWKIFSFGPYGWSWIGGTFLLGGLSLTYISELIFGKYAS
ncbi:hypothetical protein UZ36_00570 [Candidatus Nitromaritima sp. SCGC AAA799-C22]|nr:hypothetical protein UZ36_00570 [Candidatus Nitromaritima sp. SCGC AAA799-C22]